MSTVKRLLCVGACAGTTIFRVPHLPKGSAKIIPDAAIQIGDGMSATAACAIVKLGGCAEFWARAGDDANGRAVIASLTEAGLDCSSVHYVPVLYSETGLAAHVGDGDVRTQFERAQAALPHAFVSVTRGAEGFFWLEGGHLQHAAGISVNAVDTRGR